MNLESTLKSWLIKVIYVVESQWFDPTQVSVNQITARLPLTRQNLHIDDTGTMYIINTPGGINIKWYHSTGIMVLQYTAPDNTSTRGLCGQCVVLSLCRQL